HPVWVTIFTSMFLHGGWLHIIGNMMYLWIFGDNVEDAFGHFWFLVFYLLSGCGAAALQILVDTQSTIPMVGASGALSGVLAAYLFMFPGRSVRVLVFLGIFVTVVTLPAILVIGFWVLLQFLAGFASLGPETAQTDGVAYFAHIGGFITGAILLAILWPFTIARRRRARYRR
ncbi:MAG: rhomboid family intramembrane serine protease, partial [Chloroflexi bacterium]